MDKIINAGKEFLEEKTSQGHGQSLPGGDKSHGGNYPAGGGFFGGDDDDDFRTAKHEASSRAGSSGSGDLFHSILGAIGQKQSHLASDHLDEDDAVKKHKKSYRDDDDEDADDKSLGTAAAIQALKLFNQGETGGKQSKGAFLGLAMSEASKLFDDKAAKGKVSSGASKESTIQQAGEVALKMYLKSQGGSQGGLMGMASSLM